jgi:membrane protease YdiL (CAAX protease family)
MLEHQKKYFVIIVCVVICIIPTFFGLFTDLLFIRLVNTMILSLIIIGGVLLFILGKTFERYFYNHETLELMRHHDLISVLINKNNNLVLLVFFPLTMIMEEFIFRYYAIGILFYAFNLEFYQCIFISSIIFSLYHIHFWFKFKNQRITIFYMGHSLLLGLLNGYILLTLGLFFCILVHYLLAFTLYINIARKISN